MSTMRKRKKENTACNGNRPPRRRPAWHIWHKLLVVLLLGTAILNLSACGRKNSSPSAGQETGDVQEAQAPQFRNDEEDTGQAVEDDGLYVDTGQDTDADAYDGGDGTVEDDGEEDTGQDPGAASGGGAEIVENGVYTTAEDVALYLHTYGKLPANFMTKKEARSKGWSGGSLEEYAPGMCIGGDRFGNYEGVLPDGNYHECDINTLGADRRGAERLVYSDDGRIYYTNDHYETFSLLYGGK